MSIQGELTISITSRGSAFHSDIISSRPMNAAQLFSGKTIEQALQTVPLLFNICTKAQAVTAVRAIESAMGLPRNEQVELQREALVCIESLREHSLQVLMEWPRYIGETLDNEALAGCVQSLNKLMQLLAEHQILDYGVSTVSAPSPQQVNLWTDCETHLNRVIFNSPEQQWPQDSLESIDNWAKQGHTQAARFINWLSQQEWKYAGHSSMQLLPEINDSELVKRLTVEQESFTAQPDWQARCYETSWFNHQENNSIIRHLQEQFGKGIYTRMIARLCEIADLMDTLQQFFQGKGGLITPISTAIGLAHTDAARGRLSHYVQLEDSSVKRLFILAPTEWNFHPQGVAANSLCNLYAPEDLRLQADLLIHAIDPCVGYQLNISGEVIH
jgi:coenzyme F420-reducing hydrogenase alpha subunit